MGKQSQSNSKNSILAKFIKFEIDCFTRVGEETFIRGLSVAGIYVRRYFRRR